MDTLQKYLDTLVEKKRQVENQDINAYVEQKLREIAPKLREEAEKSQAYDKQVLTIRIETITDLMAVMAHDAEMANVGVAENPTDA